ncbi:MAG: CHAT domain-containing tetratricopeptide repeat protein [Puia sp.]|nr:CHAT domain-containing tetratricopeptide repeat protein [Puia sp.]
MPGKTFAISVLLLIHALGMRADPIPPPDGIKTLYHKADQFFNLSHPTRETDLAALTLFSQVIEKAENSHSREDLLFQSYIKKGILLDIKGSYTEALSSYQGALQCFRRHPDWSDSLSFKVYIYAGSDYYHADNFDSAYSLLNKAEGIADKHPGLEERDRLYNALGALYYESGNYLQGRNYFNRAMEIIRKERPDDKTSINSFANNIASCLYKLGSYRESLEMYRRLGNSGKYSDEIDLNMGKSYIGLGEYGHAMTLYRKANPEKVPGIFNEMAYAQYLMGENDSALYFLDKWRTKVSPARQTKIDAGINDLYRAQVLMTDGLVLPAIDCLQRAIITFSGTFKNTDIRANPLNFTGSFASYRLFDALSAKANALKTLYKQHGREEDLLAARQAYSSAILLFRYIEKTYTTDDARLFLKKNNQFLYENAFLVSLELDRLHPGGPYLEEAFVTAEKSKASILSGNLDLIDSRKIPGIDPQLLQRQRAIKYNIARLELKSDPEHARSAGQSMASQKADYEIELSFVQKNMELNSDYCKMKFSDSCPSIKDLREQLDTRQALISLFVSAEGLHLFLLTKSSFRYIFIDSFPSLSHDVQQWIDLLNETGTGLRFGNRPLEARLSERLVRPIREALKGTDEWTIIPDDIFYLLPFESLPADDQGHTLIENTTISYQLSAKFLAGPFLRKREVFDNYSVLSFAPFAGKGEWVNTHTLKFMDRLPASAPEIAGLPGRQFLNEQASKEHFLQEMNHYPVVHLATHALSDPLNSQSSMICFYPRHGGAVEDCLFLQELYGLNMDSTDLVILSACESGKGELVDNEGMMSLSRGFLYAGCASTVNSLWKADDASTEAILQAFHRYLEKGYTKAAALRQAKLDYIHSNAIYTTPNYWAHLILVGNTDSVIKKGRGLAWLYLLGGCICLGALITGVFFIWRARSKDRSRSYLQPAY